MRRLLQAILYLFIVFLLVGCSAQTSRADNEFNIENYSVARSGKRVMVYYIMDGFLTPVTYTIDDSELEVNAALNLLFSGITPDGFESHVLGAQLNAMKVSGDTVSLDISGDPFQGEKGELAKSQIVFTLTDCPNILNVSISVDGDTYWESLKRPTYINLIDPDTYQQDMENPEELDKYITIYYPDKTAKYLIPITIKSDKIQIVEDQDKSPTIKAAHLAEVAMQHLMEGANEIGLGFDEKMIKSLQVKDGVAIVDLNRHILLNKFSTKTQYAEIAIKAVVRTLTSIDGIDKVQFLVDGVKMGYITGNINIQNPIGPDKWYNSLTD
mgnify:CR=1 FL=1